MLKGNLMIYARAPLRNGRPSRGASGRGYMTVDKSL